MTRRAVAKVEQQFGERLRHVRHELARETRKALAAVLDVDPMTVYRWEHGDGSPRAAVMAKLLHHYAPHAAFLLDGGKPAPLPPELIAFLRTAEGRKAKARGMLPMLASIQFPKSASIQTYTKVMLALWDEFDSK